MTDHGVAGQRNFAQSNVGIFDFETKVIRRNVSVAVARQFGENSNSN